MEDRSFVFTKDRIEHAIKVWENAAFTLMDIRHALIKPGDLYQYHTSYFVLLFICGKEGKVGIDETIYQVERFSLFHLSKGVNLTIACKEDWLEYYIVLYKTKDPGFYRKEYLHLMEQENPFQQKFGFLPENPIYFLEQLKRMYEKWIDTSTINRLFAKTTFYQLIYEMYLELYEGKGRGLCLDMVETVKRHIEEHYKEEISIQVLADSVHISTSQLSRLFKAQEMKSPKEYLTDKRLNASKMYLTGSNATIREIALYCGFSDEFCFTKTFKRYNKITPGDFRKITTSQLHDFTIGNPSFLPYNKESSVSLNELKEGGNSMIFKNMKNKALLATAISSLMLLAACQTDVTDTSKEAVAESSKDETTQSAAKANEEESRVIHMEYGDVEIPANPQRVVVAFFQGDLLALGIKPVGTSFNDDAIFANELSDVTIVDAFELNPEAIMELEPDLIIWNNQDDYEELSKIAPTIAMNFYSGLTYKERLNFFGEVFGLEDEAEQLIKDFEGKVAEAKETLTQNGLIDKNVILLENKQQGVLRAFGDNYGRGGEIIYQYLGFSAPERIQTEIIDKEDVYFIDIGYEMLNQYIGDYIFSNEEIDTLATDSMWTSLPAVKEGRLIKVSSGMFWFSDITSMNAQVDFIMESLLKTVK